jgi:hydroxypyruvate reductase
MAQATEMILGAHITDGMVVTKYHHSVPLKHIRCVEAAHPVPDENGLSATAATLDLLKTTRDGDIIICLLSGGASSLWADLPPGITLSALQQVFEGLLHSGATINEMNAVRKHLSLVKGGQLPRYAAAGARWFNFIISDVPGDRLDTIASGPTVPDESSFVDVKEILDRYGLTGTLPPGVVAHIDEGLKGNIPETADPADPLFANIENKIIGKNATALAAAEAEAVKLGYTVPFIDDTLNGDAATVGREFTRSCKKYTGPKPACFLLGGETTVVVKGKGKGGRNQHMALSALCEMAVDDEPGCDNTITFLAAGTDGTDGPTDAAGALVDAALLKKAALLRMEPQPFLANLDAYTFFDGVGGLVKTGPTQTNVMDLVVVIVE